MGLEGCRAQRALLVIHFLGWGRDLAINSTSLPNVTAQGRHRQRITSERVKRKAMETYISASPMCWTGHFP